MFGQILLSQFLQLFGLILIQPVQPVVDEPLRDVTASTFVQGEQLIVLQPAQDPILGLEVPVVVLLLLEGCTTLRAVDGYSKVVKNTCTRKVVDLTEKRWQI